MDGNIPEFPAPRRFVNGQLVTGWLEYGLFTLHVCPHVWIRPVGLDSLGQMHLYLSFNHIFPRNNKFSHGFL